MLCIGSERCTTLLKRNMIADRPTDWNGTDNYDDNDTVVWARVMMMVDEKARKPSRRKIVLVLLVWNECGTHSAGRGCNDRRQKGLMDYLTVSDRPYGIPAGGVSFIGGRHRSPKDDDDDDDNDDRNQQKETHTHTKTYYTQPRRDVALAHSGSRSIRFHFLFVLVWGEPNTTHD